ncbi:MAG TPA: sigma-70 family RNA polymerase sigma factor [Nannocystaceae bacterium]|nr:sigma-70 family RNA polymerase sigma factor [Nannocystaceae bacterium]
MAPAAAHTPPFDPRLHAPLVRRALQTFGVPSEALDDAVQDVFVVLVRRANDFDRERSVVNWLWGVARGVASTHRRTRSRRGRLHDALTVRESPSAIGPDEAWARQRATDLVTRFLAKLDPTLREVFVRSELMGCSGPELAEELGINLNTAYARVRTVRLRFEAELELREGVIARLARIFAPFGLFAPKSLATAAIGASLVVASASLVPSTAPPLEPTLARAVTPEQFPIAHRAPRKLAEPANDEGMKTAVLTTVALTTVLAQAAPAQAKAPKQRRAAPEVSDSDADDAARKEGAGNVSAYYDFVEGDRLTGEVIKPEGMPVDARTRARFPSLLNIRGHFMSELVTMAKDV